MDCGGVDGLEARLLTSEPSPFFMGTSSDELACPFSSDPPASFSVHMLGTGGSLALLVLLLLLLLLLLPLALPDVVVVVVVVAAGEAMETLPLLLLLLMVVVVVVVVVVVLLLLTEGVLPLSAMLFSRSRWQSLRFRILLQHTTHDTLSGFCCNTRHTVRLLLQHATHDTRSGFCCNTQHTTRGQAFAATHNTRHAVRILLQHTTHDTRSGADSKRGGLGSVLSAQHAELNVALRPRKHGA